MFILFDIGGTKMRVAGARDFDSFGEIKIAETPTDFNKGIKKLIFLINETAAGEKIEAIAGGIAGPFGLKTGALLTSPNLSGWIDKPFRKTLEEEFKTPIYIENDAAMAGIGEAIKGEGKGYEIVGYITVSTGVGGSRIVNGEIDERSAGFEPGQQIIDASQTLCPECSGLELGHMISGKALEERFGKKAYEIKELSVWNELADWLGIGLYNTIIHWSPDVMVLGGPMITGSPAIPIDRVKKKVDELLKIFPKPPKILKSTLGDDNGLYGALEYIKHENNNKI